MLVLHTRRLSLFSGESFALEFLLFPQNESLSLSQVDYLLGPAPGEVTLLRVRMMLTSS